MRTSHLSNEERCSFWELLEHVGCSQCEHISLLWMSCGGTHWQCLDVRNANIFTFCDDLRRDVLAVSGCSQCEHIVADCECFWRGRGSSDVRNANTM